MQCYFRQDGIDEFSGDKAHKYGSSPANQWIEGWWSFFRRGRAGWWIDLFKDMGESGVLDIDHTLHMKCLWFCFQSVLQDELDKVKDHWNSHCIWPGRPQLLETFKHSYALSKGENEIRNRITKFWWATHFWTKNLLNKPVMNNRRLLIAAVFHSVHPVKKKTLKKHYMLTQNSVSFSCQSKQLSRCCINFLHELTCQILTNQSIKIGRRAWPTRDHGKKRSSLPVFFKNWLNFRVRGQFEIKIFTVRGHSDINNIFHMNHWNKINLSLRSFATGNLSVDDFNN